MPLQVIPFHQNNDLVSRAQAMLANLNEVNQAMEAQASLGAASEDFLLDLLERLTGGFNQASGFWPTLARLAELALFSAGSLALAGEFAACGDILINPDGKLLHIMGSPRPFAVKRHRALTRQVAHLVPPGWQTIQWLKKRTFLQAPQKALLPSLREALEEWPQPRDYLQELDRDWETLASGLTLLVGLDSNSRTGLPEALEHLSQNERFWLESRIYRPSLQRFHALGRLLADDYRRT
jgi:hypothetical protein